MNLIFGTLLIVGIGALILLLGVIAIRNLAQPRQARNLPLAQFGASRN
jgi:hypothetical protein